MHMPREGQIDSLHFPKAKYNESQRGYRSTRPQKNAGNDEGAHSPRTNNETSTHTLATVLWLSRF